MGKTSKKVAILSWIKWNKAYAGFETDVCNTLKKTKGKEAKEGIDCRYVGQDNDGNWIEVTRRKSSRTKTNNHTALYTTTKNNFTPLTEDTDPSKNTHDTITNTAHVPQKYMMSDIPGTKADKQERKIQQREHFKLTLILLAQQDDLFLNNCITQAEDKQTTMAKADTTNAHRQTINKAHNHKTANDRPPVIYMQ